MSLLDWQPCSPKKSATLPESERIQFHHHVVANGETLSQLVNRYGVSMTLITGTNGIANQNMIRAGQTPSDPCQGCVAGRRRGRKPRQWHRRLPPTARLRIRSGAGTH